MKYMLTEKYLIDQVNFYNAIIKDPDDYNKQNTDKMNQDRMNLKKYEYYLSQINEPEFDISELILVLKCERDYLISMSGTSDPEWHKKHPSYIQVLDRFIEELKGN